MKTLKHIVGCAVLTILINACTKQGSMPTASGGPTLLSSAELPADANHEMRRIYNTLQKADHEVMIIDNTNYDHITDLDVMISGATNPADNISVEIDGELFSARPDGQWSRQDEGFRKLYGKKVHLSVKSGKRILNEGDLYIPKPQIAKRIQDEKNGFWKTVVNWIVDENEATKKIFFRYFIFNSAGLVISSGTKILDNTGSFDYSEVFNSQKDAYEITFSLISGNWIPVNIKGKTLLFGIATHNHHSYDLSRLK